MSSIKTAISIEKPLFKEIETLAEEMGVSRSSLFVLAAREFIEHHKNQKLFEAINLAQDAPPDSAEERLRAQMRSKHRRLVMDQW